MDNGPELISRELVTLAAERGIALQFIQRGKPTQNAYIERFNRTYLTAVLDCYVFNSLGEVRALTQEWLHQYNHTARLRMTRSWPMMGINRVQNIN